MKRFKTCRQCVDDEDGVKVEASFAHLGICRRWNARGQWKRFEILRLLRGQRKISSAGKLNMSNDGDGDFDGDASAERSISRARARRHVGEDVPADGQVWSRLYRNDGGVGKVT